jgi:diguanylate cyclase (GGDEF)-like protein
MTEPGTTTSGAGRQTVLVIDDDEDIHALVEARLRPENVEVRTARDARAGLQEARRAPPDLILLDLGLPDSTGLELFRSIQACRELAEVPVIFLSGTADVGVKVQAFDAGAADYVTKPFDAVELRARVRATLRAKRYRDLLATRAQLDGLTGLWNRAYFDQRLGDEVAAAVRHERRLSLIMVDIDHFKTLNDAHGHPFGDLVLRRVADALLTCLRAGDAACRYGGDEFGLILREADAAAAAAAAERTRLAIGALDFRPAVDNPAITASLGYASNELLTDPRNFTAAELIAAADAAMYGAKRGGRNRISHAHG